MPLIDLTGLTYGRLTVIRRGKTLPRSDGGTIVSWECKCSCGNNHEVAGRTLKAGESKSCGCRGNGQKPQKETAFNELFSLYKTRAIRKGYGFNLTKPQFKILTKSNCFYCGIEPKQTARSIKKEFSYTYNGVDRVDNNKGYLVANTVPCCGFCNKAKNTMSQSDFYEWVERVYKYRLVK